jgi:hypothetical protein
MNIAGKVICRVDGMDKVDPFLWYLPLERLSKGVQSETARPRESQKYLVLDDATTAGTTAQSLPIPHSNFETP